MPRSILRLAALTVLLLMVACQSTPLPQSAAAPTVIPTSAPASLIGRPLHPARPSDSKVYVQLDDRRVSLIADYPAYVALAYQPNDLLYVPADQWRDAPVGMPLTRWLTGIKDQQLYFLYQGKRYPITDAAMLAATGGSLRDVSQIPDSFLDRYPPADAPIPEMSAIIADIDTQTIPPPAVPLEISDATGNSWRADVNHYDLEAQRYVTGRGLIHRDANGAETVFTLEETVYDPLRNITALAVQDRAIWIGTRYSGLLRLDVDSQTWQHFDLYTSALPDNGINAMLTIPDGSLWIATRGGVARWKDGQIASFPFPDEGVNTEPLILEIDPATGRLRISGTYFVALMGVDGTWEQVETAFTYLDLLGLDTNPQPTEFPLPSPTTDYQAYLAAWMRPAEDNGRCIHYLASPLDDVFELRLQIARLHKLNIKWLLVNYTSRTQMLLMAPEFKRAGITVIWRPFVRPYREYPYWMQDVTFLRAIGVPPYMQIYNEPSLGQEWQDAGRQVDQTVYLEHLFPAIQQVYEAGGFVGLQELQPEWVRLILSKLKEDGQQHIFDRLFFIPHAYGYNRPPETTDTIDSVLGFREFATVFQEEIGFVPMMIAGEGGWRPGEQQDKRFPMVTPTLHRDYLLAVIDWFRTGELSDGTPLPDYFFAFCPWILADPNDPAAWYDSAAGERDLITYTVSKLPPFTRRFSWELAQPR